MKSSAFFLSLCPLALLTGLTSLVGCSSSSSSGSGANTLSCMTQVQGSAPICQFYEASGPDAANAISALRAGCVNQSGLQLSVVESCPTEGSLGGCKTPVAVEGGAKVSLSVTNYSYAPGADADVFSPSTVQQVEQTCTDENGTYVSGP